MEVQIDFSGRDKNLMSLLEAPVGVPLKVRYFDCGKEASCRLVGLGVLPGTDIFIVSKFSANGPFSVMIRGTKVMIGRGLLRKIFVEIDAKPRLSVLIVCNTFDKDKICDWLHKSGECLEEKEDEFELVLKRNLRIRFSFIVVSSQYVSSVRDISFLKNVLFKDCDLIWVITNTNLSWMLETVERIAEFSKVVMAGFVGVVNNCDIKKMEKLLGIKVVDLSSERPLDVVEDFLNVIRENPVKEFTFLNDKIVRQWLGLIATKMDLDSLRQICTLPNVSASLMRVLEFPNEIDLLFPEKKEDLSNLLKEFNEKFHRDYGRNVWDYLREKRIAIITGVIEECMIERSFSKKLSLCVLAIGGWILSFWLAMFGLVLISKWAYLLWMRTVFEQGITYLLPVFIFVVVIFSFVPFFVFCSFIRRTGILYRVAFCLDRFLHKFRLHGISLQVLFGTMVCSAMDGCIMHYEKDKKRMDVLRVSFSFAGCLGLFLLFSWGWISKFGIMKISLFLLLVALLGRIYSLFMSLIVRRFFGSIALPEPQIVELPRIKMFSFREIFSDVRQMISAYIVKMLPMLIGGYVILIIKNVFLSYGYNPFVAGFLISSVSREFGLMAAMLGGSVLNLDKVAWFWFFGPGCIFTYLKAQRTLGLRIWLIYGGAIVWAAVLTHLLFGLWH